MSVYKKFFSTMAVAGIVSTVAVPAPVIQAAEVTESTVVNYVVVNVKNTQIVIDLVTFNNVLLGFGDPAFETYLKDGKDYIELTALKIGNKYVGLVEYALNLLNYDGNVSQAVANTPATSTKGFKQIIEFNGITGQPTFVDLSKTVVDLNAIILQVAPGIYAIKIALADAQTVGGVEGSTLKVKVVGKEDIVLSYNSANKVFYNSNIQGYTLEEIQSGTFDEVTSEIKPTTNTVSNLNGTIIQFAPGVYALKIALADAQTIGIKEGATVVIKVKGKEDIHLKYNETQKIFFNSNVQGYTQLEISQGIVVEF